MTVTQFRYALAVAETGSITKAADRIGVRQPSVSGAISELEREVHLQLFERSGRGVRVTASGRAFLSEIAVLFQSIQRMEERYQPISFR
jgi:DNA-binding transcriptional LysR family regulator